MRSVFVRKLREPPPGQVRGHESCPPSARHQEIALRRPARSMVPHRLRPPRVLRMRALCAGPVYRAEKHTHRPWCVERQSAWDQADRHTWHPFRTLRPGSLTQTNGPTVDVTRPLWCAVVFARFRWNASPTHTRRRPIHPSIRRMRSPRTCCTSLEQRLSSRLCHGTHVSRRHGEGQHLCDGFCDSDVRQVCRQSAHAFVSTRTAALRLITRAFPSDPRRARPFSSTGQRLDG